MKPLLILSAVNTGTHFVRMMLESHPLADWCIYEDFQLLNGELLRGRLLGFLRGQIGVVDFLSDFYEVRARNEQRLAYVRSTQHEQFNLVTQTRRTARLPLLHAHAGHDWLSMDIEHLPLAMAIPVRHPLLMVCSIFRRNRYADDIADEAIAAARWLWDGTGWRDGASPRSFVVVNPWQVDRHGIGNLLGRYSLPRTGNTDRFMNDPPRVNETLERHKSKPDAARYEQPTEQAEQFRRAKARLLDDGSIDDCLVSWNQKIRESGLWDVYCQRCIEHQVEREP